MSRNSILDHKIHHDIRVINKRGSEFGEDTHIIPVLADEVRIAAADFPIFFIKNNETGRFGLNIITGFEAGENLFLDGESWTTHYVPLHVMRQPFLVGVNGSAEDEATTKNTVISIDLENKRVNKTEGELLFNENGEPTPYLDSIGKMLTKLIEGMPRTDQFIQALLQNDLIMPVQLDLSLKSGEKKSLGGLYGIDEQKLNDLKGEALQNFHEKGYLQACFMILASLGQVQTLVNLKSKL